MTARAYLLTADGALEGDPLGFTSTAPDELEQLVLVSLFSDARAGDDEDPGDGTANRRGWFGDAYFDAGGTGAGASIGSRLWLLRRQKATPANVALARQAIADALAWLVTAGVASSVDVVAQRRGIDRVDLLVTVSRDGRSTALSFAGLWGA